MDFNTLKDRFINGCKTLNNIIIDSPFFYLIKEKYDHLSSLNRKIFHVVSLLIFVCIFLYYPTAHLYFSWRNIQDFNTKKKLTQELIDLSSATQTSSSQSYDPNQDPIQFINKRIITLQIPKNQIKTVKKSKVTQKPDTLPLPATVQTVEIEMKNLNLKEIIQYGHQLEQLSKNIKLMNLYITERSEKDNYFNVSYALSFFNPVKKTLPIKEKKQTQPKPVTTKNNEVFNKLKTKKPLSRSIPKPPIEKHFQDTDADPQVPLLKLKKEDIVDGNTHFKNQPERVKRRDLLPRPSALENKKDTSANVDLPPPPPSIDNLSQPDLKDATIKEKK